MKRVKNYKKLLYIEYNSVISGRKWRKIKSQKIHIDNILCKITILDEFMFSIEKTFVVLPWIICVTGVSHFAFIDIEWMECFEQKRTRKNFIILAHSSIAYGIIHTMILSPMEKCSNNNQNENNKSLSFIAISNDVIFFFVHWWHCVTIPRLPFF